MNMSFALTKTQYRARSKTVTRRMGWLKLQEGDIFKGVEKSQGLKKGEHVVVMGKNKVISARREPLRRLVDEPEYGKQELINEGFPDLSPEEFVRFFCATHHGATPEGLITRIEFDYIEE